MTTVKPKEVQFGVRCPDDSRDLAPTGTLVAPDYTWILVPGGATTVGYYDPYSNNRHEPRHGPGQDLLSIMLTEIPAVVRQAFGDYLELHIRSVDLYLCGDCRIRERIEYHRTPAKLDVWEQAPETIMFILKNARTLRNGEGKKLNLSGLVPKVYPERSDDNSTWPGGHR